MWGVSAEQDLQEGAMEPCSLVSTAPRPSLKQLRGSRGCTAHLM